MINKKLIKEKYLLAFSFCLTVIILTTPLIARFVNDDPLIIGDKPYYHIRLAEEISNKDNVYFDQLSYTGRIYIKDIYDYFLSFIYSFDVVFILPFILGISSVILFYYLIKKIRLNLLANFLIILTLILSPVFIYTFTTLNKHSLVIFLMLSAFLCFLDKRKTLNMLSIPIFSVIPFFNKLAALILVLLLFFYSMYNRKKNRQLILILAILLSITITHSLFIYFKYGFPERTTFISLNYFKILLSDLGSQAGLAIFNLILTIIGIIVTWKHKKKLWLIYTTILILLLSLPYFDYSNIYLKFIIAVFTGVGFHKLVSMKWKLHFIRDLSIFILILGLIFSTTSYINRSVKALPDKNIRESLEWLEVYSDTEDIVLSHYSYGYWIEYYARRATIMDSLFRYAPRPNERFRDINAIFHGTNLESTKTLLDKYEIDYIYIDNNMKHTLIWKSKRQGLLFLFRNSETFKNIYNKAGIEIWEYKKD